MKEHPIEHIAKLHFYVYYTSFSNKSSLKIRKLDFLSNFYVSVGKFNIRKFVLNAIVKDKKVKKNVY